MKVRLVSILSVALILTLGLFSCTQKAQTKPKYIFADPPDEASAAKVDGKLVARKDVFAGAENEIYEAQTKLYDLRMNALKSYLLKTFIEKDPKSKGMSEEEYINKYMSSNAKISDKEVQAFIAEKKIPKEHLNDKMNERIKKYLQAEKQRDAVELWLAEKTQKFPVEVYIQKPERPVFDIKPGNSPSWGDKNSKVTLIEFSDFQCPFCSKATAILNELKKKYKGKIRVVFKQFPLNFHNQAKKAAEASLCAHEQSPELFWKMHDAMFADQSKLDDKGLKETAKKVGLKEADFAACLSSGKFAKQVEAEMEEGKDVGVRSTPTFFINGKLIAGAQSIEVFSELIDQELK